MIQGTRAIPRLDLGAAVMEYMEDANEFIGTKVLPIFPSKVKSANYPAITRESITRDAETKRAPNGAYNRDDFEAEDYTFNCKENGLEGRLDDSQRTLYENDFDAELATSQIVMRRLLQGQEKRIADLVFNTSTFTGSALYTDRSGAAWSTASNGVISHVRAAKTKVRANCGMKPNAIIMSDTVKNYVIDNDGVKDAIKYTSRATEQEILGALASLFDVKYVLIANAIRNSAKEGQAFVSADVWSGLYCMVARIIENPKDLTEPGLGRTFLWTSDSPENATVEEYREENVRSGIFRVRQHTDEVIVDPYFGHLLKVAS